MLQQYLFAARRWRRFRSACTSPFGIAFPAIVLFAEWRELRTGDELFRMLAKRWSRAMLALFAVGVVTGTILSFEFGLLWPRFMAAFGSVFGLGFALEGFSLFVEAIFIAIYAYGLAPAVPATSLSFPVVIAGVTGSLFVISVNGLDEPPRRVRPREWRRRRRTPVVGAVRQHLLLAPVRAHVLGMSGEVDHGHIEDQR